MRNSIGTFVLGAAVVTGACAKNIKPADVKSCPMPAHSASAEAPQEPEAFHTPGPYDVPEMVDKDYLLAPTNPNEFEETMFGCVAALKAADFTGAILSKSPVKSCRTVQHVYDAQKGVIDACKPVVYAEGFSYSRLDPTIMPRIFAVKAEMKKWVEQVFTLRQNFPECFQHGPVKPKKLPTPPDEFENKGVKILQTAMDGDAVGKISGSF